MSSHEDPVQFWTGIVIGLAVVLPLWAVLGWLFWAYL
jgi:hypothetical protein